MAVTAEQLVQMFAQMVQMRQDTTKQNQEIMKTLASGQVGSGGSANKEWKKKNTDQLNFKIMANIEKFKGVVVE